MSDGLLREFIFVFFFSLRWSSWFELIYVESILNSWRVLWMWGDSVMLCVCIKLLYWWFQCVLFIWQCWKPVKNRFSKENTIRTTQNEIGFGSNVLPAVGYRERQKNANLLRFRLWIHTHSPMFTFMRVVQWCVSVFTMICKCIVWLHTHTHTLALSGKAYAHVYYVCCNL